MLSVLFLLFFFAECRYAECCYAACRYAECRYAKCCYADCRGTCLNTALSPLQNEETQV
jgi:hypothetical protein